MNCKRNEGVVLDIDWIATAMNHRAFLTRRGTAWRLESVARTLKHRDATRTHTV
jgi:hypothetical protein